MYAALVLVSLLASGPTEVHSEDQRPHPEVHPQHMVEHVRPAHASLDWVYQPPHYHGEATKYYHLNQYPMFKQRQYFRAYNYRNLIDYPWHEELYPQKYSETCGPTIYRLSTPDGPSFEEYHPADSFSIRRSGKGSKSADRSIIASPQR